MDPALSSVTSAYIKKLHTFHGLKRARRISIGNQLVILLLCGQWAVSSLALLALDYLSKLGFADYLEPGHHQRGIMSLAFKTLISEWMIPRVNCHHITGTTFIGNRASGKVLLNNEFVQLEKDVPDWAPIPEERGGGKMGLHVFRWRRPKSEDED
jgi:hypothetical protein